MKKSILLLATSLVLGVASVAHAVVSVTPATGGAAISADTAAASFTTLTGPVIEESEAGEVPPGTIVLHAPEGFEWNTNASVTVTVGGGGDGDDLQLLASAAEVTTGTITVTVVASSTDSRICTLTWSGIEVRPLAGTPLASGSITVSGTAQYDGDSEDYGEVQQVPGAPFRLVFTQEPGNGPPGGLLAEAPALAMEDQFGNPTTAVHGSLTVAIELHSGSGLLSGTTALDIGAAGGAVEFTDIRCNTAGTKHLRASAPGLEPAISDAFVIDATMQAMCTMPISRQGAAQPGSRSGIFKRRALTMLPSPIPEQTRSASICSAPTRRSQRALRMLSDRSPAPSECSIWIATVTTIFWWPIPARTPSAFFTTRGSTAFTRQFTTPSAAR